MKLVEEQNKGMEIRPVSPWLISSTDDTTLFVFEGNTEDKCRVSLVDINCDSSTRSNFSSDIGGTDHKNGIRVRHTVTMNATGKMAALYVQVYGLSKEQLCPILCPLGICALPLKGFAYGASQDCSNTTIGWVMFIRNQTNEFNETNDQKNHEHYRDEVFLPYVEGIRAHHSNDEWTNEMQVLDEQLWVSW